MTVQTSFHFSILGQPFVLFGSLSESSLSALAIKNSRKIDIFLEKGKVLTRYSITPFPNMNHSTHLLGHWHALDVRTRDSIEEKLVNTNKKNAEAIGNIALDLLLAVNDKQPLRSSFTSIRDECILTRSANRIISLILPVSNL